MVNEFIDMVVLPASPILATFIAALGGAYYGANFQHKNQIEAANKKRQDAEVAVANLAIFVLLRQYNELHNLESQAIREHRAKPFRHIVMPAVLSRNYEHLKFDFDSLGFLLETEHRTLLPNLYSAEAKLQEIAWVINRRSFFTITTCCRFSKQKGLDLAPTTLHLTATLTKRVILY